MRVLFWLLAVFAAAVALVILGRVGAGYVMFVYPPYRVELSLPFFVVASLAGFLLLYAAMRLLGHAVSLPTYVRAYRSRRRRERAHAALAAALQAYYEGRYARAEKEAAAAFEAGPTPGLAALLAARAAHQMRDFERRDRWLERAEEAGEGLQTARLVSRAEFALEERDFARARPRHPGKGARRGVDSAARCSLWRPAAASRARGARRRSPGALRAGRALATRARARRAALSGPRAPVRARRAVGQGAQLSRGQPFVRRGTRRASGSRAPRRAPRPAGGSRAPLPPRRGAHLKKSGTDHVYGPRSHKDLSTN